MTAAAQPGRAWTEEQLWHALVLRPTAGGAWLRRVRGRKGDEAARGALRRVMRKAHALVAANPTLSSRADAAGELVEIRELAAAHRWRSRAGSTELKVVLAHLDAADRAGGRQYTASQRQLAERAGCVLSTLQEAHKRLGDTWFTVAVAGGAVRGMGDPGAEQATVWQLRRPEEIRARLAALAASNSSNVSGHPLPPQAPQVGGVPDTRMLAAVMAHDAMHEYAHGGTGARILATLDPTEGMSPADLAEAVGCHPATIRRKLARMTVDRLVTCTDGLYYRPAEVAEERLTEAAEHRGTTGRGARRAWRHAQERARRRAYLAYLATRPRRDQVDPLVPLEAIDPTTGEILPDHAHHWTGWDVSDPYRPVWRGTQAA